MKLRSVLLSKVQFEFHSSISTQNTQFKQGAFHAKLTPEVRQYLLRCTPRLKVGTHLTCKDQKKCASRFAFYYASRPEYSLGYPCRHDSLTPTLSPSWRSTRLSTLNAPWQLKDAPLPEEHLDFMHSSYYMD